MQRKAIIPLILGLGIGLVTVKLAVDTIRKARAANQPAELITVVRATQDIGANEEISPEMVAIVETADSPFAPEGERFGVIEDVIGRVTAKGIPAQTPVLASMLAPEGTSPRLVGRIPPGFRAVSVKIDEVSAVAFQLKAGDWVDVIVVMDIESDFKRNRKETIAEVILQHVQVAAIGHSTNQDGSSGTGKAKAAKSATLLVAEADVPKLHLAGTRGKITLSMRGEDETIAARPARADMSGLLSRILRPKPDTKGNMDGFMSAFSKMMASKPSVRPEPIQKEPQHLVMVVHASAESRFRTLIERVTFDGVNSARIIDVSEGPPTRMQTSMGTNESSGRSALDKSVRGGGGSGR